MNQDLLAGLPDNVARILAPAFEHGVMGALDLAFVQLLAARSEHPCETTLLLGAGCSHGNGHVCLTLKNGCEDPGALFSEPSRQLMNLIDWWQAQNPAELEASLQASQLVDCAGDRHGNTPLVLEQGRLYLRRIWRDEVDVSEQIQQRLSQAAAAPEALPQQLDNLFPATGDIDWQRVACALATRGYLTLITGGPGTGKTTTVVRLLALLQSSAMARGESLRIRLAAPTGKAAARLTSAIGNAVQALPVSTDVRAAIPREVVTLHKLLGRRPDSRRFRHHEDNPLHADLVIVDEASMVDLEMMAALLRALSADTRLVLIGDKDQLSSVEAGAVMGDLCLGAARPQYLPDTRQWLEQATGLDLSDWQGNGSLLAQHTAMLRTTHRFSAHSGIGALAGAVNAGDVSASAAVWQAGHEDLSRINQGSRELGELAVTGFADYLATLNNKRPGDSAGVVDWASDVLAGLGRFQLLCALREGPSGTNTVNALVANALHGQGLLEKTEGWYEGRPVMVTRNDYQSGLMNGDVGVALNVPHSDGSVRLRVAFQLADGSLKLVLPSRLDQVETTFAMTVHKSQGSEFDHVALVLPRESTAVVTRELIYTAITRARRRFTLVCDTDASWQTALARPTRRASGLAARLHGNGSDPSA